MKEKRIASRTWLFICICGIIIYIPVLGAFLGLLIKNKDLLFLIPIMISLFIIFIFLFAMNRLCCIIWKSDTQIGRRGLFWGFRYKVEKREIKQIIIRDMPRDARYIFLIDDFQGSFEGLSKRCYIRLQDTPENTKFVNSL